MSQDTRSAATVELSDLARRLRLAARMTSGSTDSMPRTAGLFSEAASALEAALAEIDRLREHVNSGRTSRERAEDLPEGTLPRV